MLYRLHGINIFAEIVVGMDNSHQLFDENIKSDKLQLLYRQSYPAVFFSLAIVSLLAILYWPEIDRDRLIVWLVAMVLASVLRILLFYKYLRIVPKGQDILKWERPYFISLLLSSMLWGVGVVAMTYDAPLLYQTITYAFLLGMAGSALAVYSAIRRFALITMFAVLLPMVLFFLIQGGVLYSVLALSGILFFLSALRATNVLADTLYRSFTLSYELTAAKEEAEQLSRTDMLTGINNRRAFVEQASAQIDYCKRHSTPICLLALDIDFFKKINDNYGHAAGDEVLKTFAQTLKHSIRSSDVCGRIGGEEFAILLSNTDIDKAMQVAEGLRKAVADDVFYTAGDAYSITASIGVSTDHYDLESLLNLADAAMYRAKEAGRNQVKQ